MIITDAPYPRIISVEFKFVFKKIMHLRIATIQKLCTPWRRDAMEPFSALLAVCAGNPSITCVFPSQRASDSVMLWCVPDSKVHGANVGPTWVLSAPDGPHVGPMNLAIRGVYVSVSGIPEWATIIGCSAVAVIYTTVVNILGSNMLKCMIFARKCPQNMYTVRT